MTLTKTDTAESQFNAFGLPNREARSGVDPSVGWGLLGKHALTHRMSVAVAGVRRFVLTLLSALLVGCGGDSDSAADTAAPQAVPLQEQILVFTQAGPLNLVVGDTLSNVASGGLGTGVISYSSSDTTVATVDAAGRLTVVGAGIAMITAEKAADTQYAAASAGYDVSATPAPQDPGPEPQSIGFEQPGPFNLVVGDTRSNMASGGPGTGVIRYSSSDPTIATVDATGQLTAVGVGVVTITAEKAADARYAAASSSYIASITRASQSIGFDQSGPLSLLVGDTLTNVASGGPGTGAIRYSSSDTTIATVDATGELTAVGFGTATITAEKAADRNYLAASEDYTVVVPIRVSMTAWVGSTDAQVTVDVPLSTGGMNFFRSTDANCDVSNVASCANGQMDFVTGQSVTDTAFTLNRVAHYVLQGQNGASEALLRLSAEERSGLEVNVNNADFEARHGHRVVVHNDRMWLIGGRVHGGIGGDAGLRNDVWWSEDGATWIQATDDAGFTPRTGHQVLSYDNKLWVLGGADPTSNQGKNDVWSSEDGVTWNEVINRGQRFSARVGHEAVVHDGRMWVLGGWVGSFNNNTDVWWSENGENWTQATPHVDSGYISGAGHQLLSYKNELWLLGSSDTNNQLWRSADNGVTWERESANAVTTALRTRRFHNRAVVHNNRLWVLPGRGADVNAPNEVLWTDNGSDWHAADVNFPRRWSQEFISYDNQLWMIGGIYSRPAPPFSDFYKNDVWRSEDGVNWRLGYNDVFLQVLP